jgi:archaellum component FlaC
MNEIEPRITHLEKMFSDNANTLTAVQADIHHMTKTFDKMEQTLGRITDVLGEVSTIRESVNRAHTRIDKIEIVSVDTKSDFNTCKATKLDKKDIEVLISEVQNVKLSVAHTAWVERVVWLLVAAAVAAYFHIN